MLKSLKLSLAESPRTHQIENVGQNWKNFDQEIAFFDKGNLFRIIFYVIINKQKICNVIDQKRC